jgi:Ni,Fe-hydrogenase III small subunit
MPYKEIKILKQHGIQYIKDLKNVKLTPLFRGMPVIGNNISETEAQMIQNLCPVNAIGTSPFSIDLGKCVFCKECQFVSKGKIIFSNNYKIATNKRQNLIITANSNTNTLIDETLIRKEIRKTFRSALKLRQVSAAGDNSAEMELNASMNVNFDLGRYGIEFVASPRHADGIVITGPISENMAKALQICYDAVPDPKIIILVGTDAISGGIFAESKAINREFLDKYHVDLYVPGNPPHPLTFINGILELLKR